MDPSKNDDAQNLRFRSFQVLSCVAPLIWMKLVSSKSLVVIEVAKCRS